MRVVVTGGGTGGHIYPALAVAEALQRTVPGVEIAYYGGAGGPEATIVPASGLAFRGFASRKLRRLISPGTVGVLLALARGYREAAAEMRRFDPDVVVSTGGYVAAATALVAIRQHRPTIVQACDAIPGRTNRLVARWATRICVWYEETARLFPASRVAVTGVPIRRDIVATASRAEARDRLGLSHDRFTVVVLGGSQGARTLNAIVLESACRLLGSGTSSVQIVHQSGDRNYADLLADAAGRLVVSATTMDDASRSGALALLGYHPRAYLAGDDLSLAYLAADIVVCRCGISTLAEVTANGLPALMVPLPTAYADHQTANAREPARLGAGILMPQAQLTGDTLAERISELQTDRGECERMAVAARALSRPKAADAVAALAAEVAR